MKLAGLYWGCLILSTTWCRVTKVSSSVSLSQSPSTTTYLPGKVGPEVQWLAVTTRSWLTRLPPQKGLWLLRSCLTLPLPSSLGLAALPPLERVRSAIQV